MQKKTAEAITIDRLFAAYPRQGIDRKNAILLIAASLNLATKYVDNASQKGITFG